MIFLSSPNADPEADAVLLLAPILADDGELSDERPDDLSLFLDRLGN